MTSAPCTRLPREQPPHPHRPCPRHHSCRSCAPRPPPFQSDPLRRRAQLGEPSTPWLARAPTPHGPPHGWGSYSTFLTRTQALADQGVMRLAAPAAGGPGTLAPLAQGRSTHTLVGRHARLAGPIARAVQGPVTGEACDVREAVTNAACMHRAARRGVSVTPRTPTAGAGLCAFIFASPIPQS